MPLDNENGSPVEPVETLQTETVEKESAPTLTEAQEPDGEKPEGESVKEPEEKPTIPKGFKSESTDSLVKSIKCVRNWKLCEGRNNPQMVANLSA